MDVQSTCLKISSTTYVAQKNIPLETKSSWSAIAIEMKIMLDPSRSSLPGMKVLSYETNRIVEYISIKIIQNCYIKPNAQPLRQVTTHLVPEDTTKNV